MVGQGTTIIVNSYIANQIKLGNKSCTIEQDIYGYPNDIEELLHILRIRWPKIIFTKTIVNKRLVIFAEWLYDMDADIVYTRNDLQQIYLERENRRKMECKQKMDDLVSESISAVIEDAAKGIVERTILCDFKAEVFEYIRDQLLKKFPDMDISYVSGYTKQIIQLNWDWNESPSDKSTKKEIYQEINQT
jgi:hypothetical protein